MAYNEFSIYAIGQPAHPEKRFRDGVDEADDCVFCDTSSFQLQSLNDFMKSERSLPF